MGYALETLKGFNEQVRGIFTTNAVTVRPEEFEVLRKHNNIPGTLNDAQLLYVEGGLFTDCCLERPVMNVTINPQRALGNAIPVIRRNTQVSKYAFMTDIAEPTGALPVNPCDDPPQVGDIAACFMETRKGRISLSTKTLELDRIIQRYCEGITSDLYLVGDVRGVSAGIASGMQENLSLMAEAAVMRQFQLLARGLQHELMRQFWTGDPTNAAVNTAGGGARQFWGMEYLVADDYDTKTWVSGTDCDKLNSDIKDFEGTCVGAANATTGVGLYEYMQTLEETLTTKASLYGYTSVEWVWVMRPEMWAALTKYLPCEMLSGNCATPLVGTTPLATQVSIDVSGMGIATVRQQMQSSQRIDVNGRTYRVILDDSMPVTTVAGPPASHESDIYFLPLRVEGQPVLFWDTADYRAVDQALRPVPGGLGGLRGWHDGGMILSIVTSLNYCFSITSKLEAGLVFLAPHLAGKIESVRSCRIQTAVTWQ
jgi:hypothetical protein